MSIDSTLDRSDDAVSADSLDVVVPHLLKLEKPYVTAILVIHDGARFLPRTLDAIMAQTRPPDVLAGVDAGSLDDGLALLRRATPHILRLGRDASFGDAVRAALEPLERRGDWLWLLHDDSAPAPDALERLLDATDRGPSIGIAGCKQIGWDDSRRLLEVGFTTSPLGARVTGVDSGDVDQGQLDHRSDVLAVSTSGMLVRRDLWDALGGPDPALAHARADLDLCQRAHFRGERVVVVPSAVVAHADATSLGQRSAADARAYAIRDRRAALHLRLAAAPWYSVPFLVVWLAFAALLRAAGRLVLKQPERAGGELLAFVLALSGPMAWWRARRRIRSGKMIRWKDFRRLQATPRQVYRQRRDAFNAYLRAQDEAWGDTQPADPSDMAPARLSRREISLAKQDLAAARSQEALMTGRIPVTWDGDRSRVADPRDADPAPASPSAPALDDADAGAVLGARRFLRPSFDAEGRPRADSGRAGALRLLVLLTVITFGAAAAGLRLLFNGSGQLRGPALLPMPDHAIDLWQSALSGWRPVGLGVAAPGDPFNALLALVAWPLGGSPYAATYVVELAALPLAALFAYWAAGAITTSRALRAWAALAWAAAPSLLFAVGSGRIAAVLAHLLLPLAGLALARTVGVVRPEPHRRGGAVATSCAGGLLITALLAAAPTLAVPIAALLVLALVLTARTRRGVIWTALIPAVLLAPWWRAVAHHPQLLLSEPGGPAGTVSQLRGASPWQLVLWPFDPARMPSGPVRSLAGEIARLLSPVLPAASTAGVLRGLAIALALPLLVLAVGAVALRPAPVRWANATGTRALWAVALITALLLVVLPSVSAGIGATGGTLVWPGTLVTLMAGLLLAAALVRLDGAARRLRLRSAGWRHLGSVAFGALTILAPLLVLAGWVANGWVATPGTWVHRGSADAIPAVAAAEAEGAAATRTLVLQVTSDGVRWTTYRAAGPRTGDWSAATSLTHASDRPMLTVIGDLLSGSEQDPRNALADADIGSIELLRGSDDSAWTTLDTATGLTRVVSTGEGVLWRVELDDRGGSRPARARLLAANGATLATLASSGNAVTGQVPAGASGRMLVLAERAHSGWQAWAGGRALTPRTYAGWAQAFDVPAAGGQIRVEYQPAGGVGHTIQMVIGIIALLGAAPLPIRRRRFLPPPARVRAAASRPVPSAAGPATGRRALRATEARGGSSPGDHAGSRTANVHDHHEVDHDVRAENTDTGTLSSASALAAIGAGPEPDPSPAPEASPEPDPDTSPEPETSAVLAATRDAGPSEDPAGLGHPDHAEAPGHTDEPVEPPHVHDHEEPGDDVLASSPASDLDAASDADAASALGADDAPGSEANAEPGLSGHEEMGGQ